MYVHIEINRKQKNGNFGKKGEWIEKQLSLSTNNFLSTFLKYSPVIIFLQKFILQHFTYFQPPLDARNFAGVF